MKICIFENAQEAAVAGANIIAEVIKAQEEIAKLAHTPAAAVRENEVAATCKAEGYTTHTCATCGDTYVDSYVEKLPHTPGKEADCENDAVYYLQGQAGKEDGISTKFFIG